MTYTNGRLRVAGIGGTLREGSTLASLVVVTPKAWKHADGEEEITDENYAAQLGQLGRLVVKTVA
jgi:hypothetical protein